MNENGETMNIKQYIRNMQFLVFTGHINQKNFKYEFLDPFLDTSTIIMMYSRTTTDNISLVISLLMEHGYRLEFIIYKRDETKNANSKVNSLQCFSRDKKDKIKKYASGCYSEMILL